MPEHRRSARPVGGAPRLAPHDRIAGQFTRTGRFAAVDPTTGRPPPGWLRWVGFAAWVLFCEEVLRRARAEVRRDAPS